MLQPSERLCGLLWTCSNRLTSFLCNIHLILYVRVLNFNMPAFSCLERTGTMSSRSRKDSNLPHRELPVNRVSGAICSAGSCEAKLFKELKVRKGSAASLRRCSPPLGKPPNSEPSRFSLTLTSQAPELSVKLHPQPRSSASAAGGRPGFAGARREVPPERHPQPLRQRQQEASAFLSTPGLSQSR